MSHCRPGSGLAEPGLEPRPGGGWTVSGCKMDFNHDLEGQVAPVIYNWWKVVSLIKGSSIAANEKTRLKANPQNCAVFQMIDTLFDLIMNSFTSSRRLKPARTQTTPSQGIINASFVNKGNFSAIPNSNKYFFIAPGI